MWNKRAIMMGAAAIFAAVVISGCGSEPISKNPEAANGVYVNQETGAELVVQYKRKIEDKNVVYPIYTMSITKPDNDLFKDEKGNQIYYFKDNGTIDDKNQLATLVMDFGGMRKNLYGSYKGDEIVIDTPMFTGYNILFGKQEVKGLENSGTGTYKKISREVPGSEGKTYKKLGF